MHDDKISTKNNGQFLARLHEVHRAIVVTSVVSVRPRHTFG